MSKTMSQSTSTFEVRGCAALEAKAQEDDLILYHSRQQRAQSADFLAVDSHGHPKPVECPYPSLQHLADAALLLEFSRKARVFHGVSLSTRPNIEKANALPPIDESRVCDTGNSLPSVRELLDAQLVGGAKILMAMSATNGQEPLGREQKAARYPIELPGHHISSAVAPPPGRNALPTSRTQNTRSTTRVEDQVEAGPSGIGSESVVPAPSESLLAAADLKVGNYPPVDTPTGKVPQTGCKGTAKRAPSWNFLLYSVLAQVPGGRMKLDRLFNTVLEWCPVLLEKAQISQGQKHSNDHKAAEEARRVCNASCRHALTTKKEFVNEKQTDQSGKDEGWWRIANVGEAAARIAAAAEEGASAQEQKKTTKRKRSVQSPQNNQSEPGSSRSSVETPPALEDNISSLGEKSTTPETPREPERLEVEEPVIARSSPSSTTSAASSAASAQGTLPRTRLRMKTDRARQAEEFLSPPPKRRRQDGGSQPTKC